MAGRKNSNSNSNGANIGYEAKLWQMADALRNNMDAAEYKHVVLGLIFLKYISDAFEAKHAGLDADRAAGADPEDPGEGGGADGGKRGVTRDEPSAETAGACVSLLAFCETQTGL